MSVERFYYVVNDDHYQRIQIYMKYNVTKKLLNSYAFYFKLVPTTNNVSFRIRLQDFERKLLGGSCDRFGDLSNLVLGIEHDFRIYNEGGYYDVSFQKNRFQAALALLEGNKRTTVEQWARGEDIVVFELHAQQVVGNKTNKKERLEGKVQLEYRPRKNESASAISIDTWEKPVEGKHHNYRIHTFSCVAKDIVLVYANTRRRNKGSLRGPRGKRLGTEEKTTLTKKIKTEAKCTTSQKELTTGLDPSLLLHLLDQRLTGVNILPPNIKSEKGFFDEEKCSSNFLSVPIKKEKACDSYYDDSCCSSPMKKGSLLHDLWQELNEPASVKLTEDDIRRELDLDFSFVDQLTTDEVLAMFD